MGFSLTPVTPEDPQCNGFAENFVKTMCKMLHTAVAEGKDPKVELQKYLMQYRAAPHTTTGKSPAEMLFNRCLKTRLPQVFSSQETDQQKEIRRIHDTKKLKQKQHFDRKKKARPKSLEPGDQVLLKQRKTTVKPPFDPNPYTVTSTEGNRVFMQRGDGKQRVRDKNNVKMVAIRPEHLQLHSTTNAYTYLPSDNDEFPPLRLTEEEPATLTPVLNDLPIASDIHSANVAEEHSENVLEHSTNEVHDTEDDNPVDDNDQLFVIDTDLEERLQQLLGAAAARDTRVTRSQGANLQWSPEMNPDNVLQEDV